ncbi:MAG: WecB/TagA/CpsF family glycosyltransferase [Candidatus Kerfeldbacteria bacterium]
MNTEKRISIFGIPIDNVSLPGAMDRINKWIVDSDCMKLIITPNPEILLHARNHPDFAAVLSKADLSVADGFGIRLFSRITNTVRGVDVAGHLMDIAHAKKLSVHCVIRKDGLSGEQDIIAAMKTRWPDAVVSAHSIMKDQWLNDPPTGISADLLLVGLGFPEQELWLGKHLDSAGPSAVGIGVGGTFDFWSGTATRAPRWIQAVHLEWLWRLLQQPNRIIRIVNAVVVFPISLLLFRGLRRKE